MYVHAYVQRRSKLTSISRREMHAIKNIYGNAECMYNGANNEVNVNFAIEATQIKHSVV